MDLSCSLSFIQILFVFDIGYVRTSSLYRVFLKKVLHKPEEKMQEKMKMT